MGDYRRSYPEFALCGLNCGLCPRYHTKGSSRCPGCGGVRFSELHPTCPIITCSRRHGGVIYCHDCASYPCERYRTPVEYDSFISYVNRLSDQQRALERGMEDYRKELDEKIDLLDRLLTHYDDGRRKGFYCLAVNLFDLKTLHAIFDQVEHHESVDPGTLHERANVMVKTMQDVAKERHIMLRLRTKRKADKTLS